MSARRTINGAYLGVPEASAFLGISERSLRWHADQKLIPFRRLSSRIVFRRAELDSKQLDRLRIRKNVNVSAFIRAAIAKALRRAA